MTIANVICHWLKRRMGTSITYNDFEDCKRFAHLYYDKSLSVRQDTYTRIFRKVKSDKSLTTKYGIKITELDRYTWRIDNLWAKDG